MKQRYSSCCFYRVVMGNLLVLGRNLAGRGCKILALNQIFSTLCDRHREFHVLDRVDQPKSKRRERIHQFFPMLFFWWSRKIVRFENISPTNLDKTHPVMRIKASSFFPAHNSHRQTILFHHLNASQWLWCILKQIHRTKQRKASTLPLSIFISSESRNRIAPLTKYSK